MFDFSWGELVVIGAVALIVIGPKELPTVLRTLGQWMTKIRRMASEFQGQFQEAMREAEMADLKREIDTATRGFGSHFDDPFDETNRPKPETKPETNAAAASDSTEGATSTDGATKRAELVAASEGVTLEGHSMPAEPAVPAAPAVPPVTDASPAVPTAPTAEPAPSASASRSAIAQPTRSAAASTIAVTAPVAPAPAPTEHTAPPTSPAPLVTEGSDRA
jgi:sec-independent protein translocase protein TatB